MEDKVLNKIKNLVIDELKTSYGYCGVAEGEKAVIINSDNGKGYDIKITIRLEGE